MKHIDYLAAWKSCRDKKGLRMRKGRSTHESLVPTLYHPHSPFCACVHGKKDTCQIQVRAVYEAFKRKVERNITIKQRGA